MTLDRRLRLFIRRAGAFLIDALLLAAAIGASQSLLARARLRPLGAEPDAAGRHLWELGTAVLPAIAYFALSVAALGGTLGDRVLGLRVVDAGGDGRLALPPALVRAVVLLTPVVLAHAAVVRGWGWAYLAAYAALALLIFSVVLQREGRGLHDLASGARVVSGGA